MDLQEIIEAVELSWEGGHALGEVLETILQPYIDEHQPGAGHLGEEYLHFINEHNFDPIHPLDSLHEHEAEVHHPDHSHDADTASSHHEDSSFHHDDDTCHYDFHDDNY